MHECCVPGGMAVLKGPRDKQEQEPHFHVLPFGHFELGSEFCYYFCVQPDHSKKRVAKKARCPGVSPAGINMGTYPQMWELEGVLRGFGPAGMVLACGVSILVLRFMPTSNPFFHGWGLFGTDRVSPILNAWNQQCFQF